MPLIRDISEARLQERITLGKSGALRFGIRRPLRAKGSSAGIAKRTPKAAPVQKTIQKQTARAKAAGIRRGRSSLRPKPGIKLGGLKKVGKIGGLATAGAVGVAGLGAYKTADKLLSRKKESAPDSLGTLMENRGRYAAAGTIAASPLVGYAAGRSQGGKKGDVYRDTNYAVGRKMRQDHEKRFGIKEAQRSSKIGPLKKEMGTNKGPQSSGKLPSRAPSPPQSPPPPSGQRRQMPTATNPNPGGRRVVQVPTATNPNPGRSAPGPRQQQQSRPESRSRAPNRQGPLAGGARSTRRRSVGRASRFGVTPGRALAAGGAGIAAAGMGALAYARGKKDARKGALRQGYEDQARGRVREEGDTGFYHQYIGRQEDRPKRRRRVREASLMEPNHYLFYKDPKHDNPEQAITRKAVGKAKNVAMAKTNYRRQWGQKGQSRVQEAIKPETRRKVVGRTGSVGKKIGRTLAIDAGIFYGLGAAGAGINKLRNRGKPPQQQQESGDEFSEDRYRPGGLPQGTKKMKLGATHVPETFTVSGGTSRPRTKAQDSAARSLSGVTNQAKEVIDQGRKTLAQTKPRLEPHRKLGQSTMTGRQGLTRAAIGAGALGAAAYGTKKATDSMKNSRRQRESAYEFSEDGRIRQTATRGRRSAAGLAGDAAMFYGVGYVGKGIEKGVQSARAEYAQRSNQEKPDRKDLFRAGNRYQHPGVK